MAAALAAHQPLRGRSLLALGLYGAAALAGGQATAHLVLAGLALAATLVAAAATFRGTRVPSGPGAAMWRSPSRGS